MQRRIVPLCCVLSAAAGLVAGLYVGKIRYEPPSLRDLESRFESTYTVQDADQSDVALALWWELRALDHGRGDSDAYAGGIQYFMMLGCRKNAESLLHRARQTWKANELVVATARAWKLN